MKCSATVSLAANMNDSIKRSPSPRSLISTSVGIPASFTSTFASLISKSISPRRLRIRINLFDKSCAKSNIGVKSLYCERISES